MKPISVRMFLTLLSLLLICSSSALADDSPQNKKDIISIIAREKHQSDTFGAVKIYFNKLMFSGEVLFSEASYRIGHRNIISTQDVNVTTQADLDFWENLQDEYPFSEKPVFFSMKSICGPVCEYIPDGVSEVSVTDNSGNPLASYTITKKEKGFTFQKGFSSNPGHTYTITLKKLQELDEIYGNIGQVQACKKYIKGQIQNQA